MSDSATTSVRPTNMSERDEDFDPIEPPTPATKVSIWLVLLAFKVCLVVHSTSRDWIWRVSVAASESLSAWPDFWQHYFWLFSNPLYVWFGATPALLLLAAPKKDSALKSIFVLMLSYWVRNLMRAFARESRPMFGDNSIVMRSSCNCSFGYPSGHSEGSAIAYGLVIYEFVVQNKTLDSKAKTKFVVAGVLIVLNVMLSRIYFGKHTIAQVLVGATLGLSFVCLSIRFEEPLVLLFRRFLNGDLGSFLIIGGSFFFMICMNFILWFATFDSSIAGLKEFRSSRCSYCFDNNLLFFRNGTASALQFVAYGFGMFLGIYLLGTKYLKHSTCNFNDLFKARNFKRVLLMVLCNLPLLLFAVIRRLTDPAQILSLSALTFLASGFSMTFGFYKLCRLFGCVSQMDPMLFGEMSVEELEAKTVQMRGDLTI